MPQELRLREFHFPHFLGNEVKKLGKFKNKKGFEGCKWSSLNASVSLRLGEFHLPPYLGKKGNGLPSMEVKKLEKFKNKKGFPMKKQFY